MHLQPCCRKFLLVRFEFGYMFLAQLFFAFFHLRLSLSLLHVKLCFALLLQLDPNPLLIQLRLPQHLLVARLCLLLYLDDSGIRLRRDSLSSWHSLLRLQLRGLNRTSGLLRDVLDLRRGLVLHRRSMCMRVCLDGSDMDTRLLLSPLCLHLRLLLRVL